MLVCIPVAALPAVTVNQIIHRPLRTPQQAVGEYLQLVMALTPEELEEAGVSTNVIRSVKDDLSDRYETYLVGFDPDSDAWYMASVDAVFDNGNRIRCLTFGDSVVHCENLSEKLDTWMGALIETGRAEGQAPAHLADSHEIVLGERVAAWLSNRRARLDGPYDVAITGQHGGWIRVEALFETGFRMGCYFTGARPIVVDYCVELPAASG
jgi:hypothetical protein